MHTPFYYFTWFYEYAVFFYGITLFISYLLLALFSSLAIRAYFKKKSYTDNETIIYSPLAPGISVIAPAYNEELSIIANVRSLLTLNYVFYEVIIINDGSTDKTLELLIEEFELVKIDYPYIDRINTQPVKQFFKSVNPAFSKLLVIDKENGKSKADGSNAGVNAAKYPYYVCTDVDCILHKDTLVELMRPIIQESKRTIIATGGPLRMANSCDFEGGELIRMRPPKPLIPRFQEIEYIRAYMLSKMGWSLVNAVPNVSGGLGLFNTEIAIKAGGYDYKSYAEDQDLIMRMIQYCCQEKIKYGIRYVPKTLCWTEGPPTLKAFVRQRTRWAQGLLQLMLAHKKMFFNPRYKRAGLIVFPYNFFFEFIAPIVEITGIIYMIVLALMDRINWPFAAVVFTFAYIYSVCMSIIAILWDQLAFKNYKTWREAIGLCLTAFVEMFLFHPIVLFSGIRGYIYYMSGRRDKWGDMQRKGFDTQKTKKPAAERSTAPSYEPQP